MRVFFILVVFLAFQSIGLSATWYVPTDFSLISTAFNSPLVTDGDTIIVLPGTYVDNIDFNGKGVTLMSRNGPGATIIDGNQNGSVFTLDNNEGNSAVIDGFTIQNGKTSLNGGGIYCWGSSPIIQNNIIKENECVKHGGGIACTYYAYPIIRDNEIKDNTTENWGGGIGVKTAYPQIKDNDIHDNDAGVAGGGIWCKEYDQPPEASTTLIIDSNNIYDNECFGRGGGIYVGAFYVADVHIMNNEIHGNECTDGKGGGILYTKITTSGSLIVNNIIYENTSLLAGGGIHYDYSVGPITNNTITENDSAQGGGISCQNCSQNRPVITNTIFWKNTSVASEEIYHDSNAPTVTYCDVEGGWPGTGNINSDPDFRAPDMGIFKLKDQYSPCVDAGDNQAPAIPAKDFEGDRRIIDGDGNGTARVDMGADEYKP